MPVLDDIQVYRKRRVLYVVISLVFLLFAGRLYQLQVLYDKEYGKQSDDNSLRIIPKDPIRGYVYDRKGRLVVDNRPSFTVTIMPFQFNKKKIARLSEILRIDSSDIQSRLKKGIAYSPFAPVKILRDVDFRMLAALEERWEEFPGVEYHSESKRYYTTDARASHVLGYSKEVSENQLKTLGPSYVPGDVVGSSGIEAKYEQTLRGEKGLEYSVVNVRGQLTGRFNNGKNDTRAREGNNLYLAIDFDVQELAESLMTGKRGAVVALDPRDGGVIALVSKPDYDLSIFSGVTDPKIWRQLNNDPSRPLFNRATLTRYPPGSTYKMLLAIAALEKGIIKPETRMSCSGSYQVGSKVFKDMSVHGSVNAVEAIQRSCNVFFYKLMMMSGLDIWSEYGTKFGFGQPTGLDILEESPGLLPTTAWMNRRYGKNGWTRGFLPSLGIGQGELGVTPIQMAAYAMAIANKGNYYSPHALASVIDKVTGESRVESPVVRKISISDETWRIVREGMRRVVEEPGGTGSGARVKGIQSAGKTGTSQNPHGKDHAWYVGFAPFENPQIAIAVLVENVGFGGSHAAPIAGLCVEQFLYGRLIRFDGQPIQATSSPDHSNPAMADSIHAAGNGVPISNQQTQH